MLLTTLLTVNWEQAPIVPPVLRLLAVLYYARYFMRFLVAKFPCAARYVRLSDDDEGAQVL